MILAVLNIGASFLSQFFRTDFGDLNLDPAFTVEGRIRLSDGKPIPANEVVMLLYKTMTQDGSASTPALDSRPAAG